MKYPRQRSEAARRVGDRRGLAPPAAADVMQGRRGEMGYEEGELELEEGEAASGGRELVVPDALTYIVRTFSAPFLFYFLLSCVCGDCIG